MRDNLLLSAVDAAVAADAFATDALEVDKTGQEGVWLQFIITRNDADADETLDAIIYGKDADAAWAITDDPVGVLPHVADGDVADGGTIVLYVKVQTKYAFIKPRYDVGGTTPSWDITYGVVSAPDREATV